MSARHRETATIATGAVLAVLGWFASEPLRAQSAPERPRMLVGRRVVDCASGAREGEIEFAGWPVPRPSSPRSVPLRNSTIDPDARQVLVVADRVRLRSLDGVDLWSVDRALLSPNADRHDAPRWLVGDRVVVPHADGGLAALDRKSGEVVWHRPEMPVDHVVVDADLVIAGGVADAMPRLHAVAVQNGARAFDCRVAGPVARVVAAPHGIAVVDLRCFTVYDRSGPQLFAVDETPEELWGHPDGWVSLRRGTLTRWSRTGERLHDVTIGDEVLAQELVVLRDGSLVLLWAAADVLHAALVAAGGTVKWQVEIPDVLTHPQHRVAAARVVGDRVFVVGPASGDTVMLEVNAADGTFAEVVRVTIR